MVIVMTREFLEEMGISRENVDVILNEYSANIERLEGELKTLTDERDSLLAGGGAQSENVLDARLLEENLALKNELVLQKKIAALRCKIGGEVHDFSDILRFVDVDELELDEGDCIKGDSLDCTLRQLRESKPYLFVASSEPAQFRGVAPVLAKGGGEQPDPFVTGLSYGI